MVRMPVVAGQFYQGSERLLSKEVASLIVKEDRKTDAIGAVSPHAGYVYSGSVAGCVFSAITPKPTYIIMGPNHTGLGSPFSLSTDDSWRTPLGEVAIDKDLTERIRRNSRHIKADGAAHACEHSIEVQLPFLQVLAKDFRFVPIVISYANLDVYRAIANDIASAVKDLKFQKSVTIIASSDMTHYEPQAEAKKKDAKAIEAILELDEAKLVERIEKMGISMCGFAPTAIMLAAAKELGATNARLVKYETSGEASGDYSSVVGYAGIVIS